MDKNIDIPLVSILLPVFNGEKHLEEAITSIIQQSYTNFELLIIDDGSTDKTLHIIKNFNDNRIKLYQNRLNIGLINTLNYGLRFCKGEFIARMDADDISSKYRIEKQVELFCVNKTIDICGTNFNLIDDKGFNLNIIRHPQSHQSIKFNFIYHSVINHPSVMFRRKVYDENNNNFYNIAYKYVEDLELWLRLVFNYKFYNINENLFNYRIHTSQVSNCNQIIQTELSNRIKYEYILKLFPYLNEVEFALVQSFFNRDLLLKKYKFNNLILITRLILKSNYSKMEFNTMFLFHQLIRIILKNIQNFLFK